MSRRYLSIYHRASGQLLARGRLGWPITRFEGNYYVSGRCLIGGWFKQRVIPGLCPYKGIYLWGDLNIGEQREKLLAWRYLLPNPLLPFIIFRVALPGGHPALRYEFDTRNTENE